MKVWVYFIATSAALPLSHGLLLRTLSGESVTGHAISLFLFFEGALWVSSVAIFLMDSYRARILAGMVPRRETMLKMTLAGALTPVVTLMISPLGFDAVGLVIAIALTGTGLALGIAAGWAYLHASGDQAS